MREQSCNGCNGCIGCGQHSGCGLCCGRRELILSPMECAILLRFAKTPFFPVGFTENSITPFCMDFEDVKNKYRTALLALQQKKLISIDADIPLAGFNDSEYSVYPVHGSMAFTGYGQMILEQLECQDTEENLC